MGFSVSELLSHVHRNWFTNASHYEVRIFGYNNDVPDSTSEIMLNCSNVNIPGANIGFLRDGKQYGIGLEKNFPTNKIFTDLNMTFYESEKENERKFFIDWMDKVYDRETKRMNFYRNFIKDIQIIQYSRDGRKVYEATAKEAWPTNISPLDRAYSNGEQIPQFNVSFQLYDLIETQY